MHAQFIQFDIRLFKMYIVFYDYIIIMFIIICDGYKSRIIIILFYRF